MSLAQRLDLRKLREDAKLGGFNPVEIIRNGGLAAYAVDYQPYGTENGPQLLPTENTNLPGGALHTGDTDPAYEDAVASGSWSLYGGRVGFDGGDNEASPGEWELDTEYNMAVAQGKMRDARLGIKRDTNGRIINNAAGAGFLGNGDVIQSKNIGRTVKLGDFEMEVDGNTPAEEWETEYGGVVGDVAGFIRFMHNLRPGAIRDRENMQAAVGGWLSSMGNTVSGWFPKPSGKPISGGNGAAWLSDQLSMGNGGQGVTFGKPGTLVYRSTEDGGSYYR